MLTKTLLITGVSNHGIGLETCARILETQKVARVPVAWNVILAQRDPDSVAAVTATRRLQDLSRHVASTITAHRCDLADFDSVRRFASLITKDSRNVDVVIMNAGTVVNKAGVTVDGNEINYQVNHLGHHLLLALIQERVSERVIFVNSSLHKKASASATLASLESDIVEGFTGMRQYSQSKLLTAYCLNHWHSIFKRRGVKVVLVSPGKSTLGWQVIMRLLDF